MIKGVIIKTTEYSSKKQEEIEIKRDQLHEKEVEIRINGTYYNFYIDDLINGLNLIKNSK